MHSIVSFHIESQNEILVHLLVFLEQLLRIELIPGFLFEYLHCQGLYMQANIINHYKTYKLIIPISKNVNSLLQYL